MSTSTHAVEDLVKKEYEAGFYTDVEADTVPPGLSEDVIRKISSKKNEPEFFARVASRGLSSLVADGAAELGQAEHRSHRLSSHFLLFRT